MLRLLALTSPDRRTREETLKKSAEAERSAAEHEEGTLEVSARLRFVCSLCNHVAIISHILASQRSFDRFLHG